MSDASRSQRRDASLHFTGPTGPATITVCTPRIVRVGVGADHIANQRANRPHDASFVGARAWPPTVFEVAEGEPVRLATSDLRLEVETSPLRLTFADAGGAWLLREPADGGMAVGSCSTPASARWTS